MHRLSICAALAAFGLAVVAATPGFAQTAPSPAEIAAYRGLHAAAADGDITAIAELLASGADTEARDGNGRTPLHVAAFASHDDAVRALIGGGADPNALENQRYDIVTIAGVADDAQMVRLALSLGVDPGAVTSLYDGTALIAAAHLGHIEVIDALIEAGAPLDHVNNLGWTALIEAVILGDGGPNHTAVVKALVEAGASRTIADRGAMTPLDHARSRGYTEMVELLSK
jgi:ankyrin repeat protein